ncbi:MAG: hypothetical protein IJQ98_00925 [Oscillospiraceae bacterium]|nr:hypothetical protein [Oscillospiraceae bacterium]
MLTRRDKIIKWTTIGAFVLLLLLLLDTLFRNVTVFGVHFFVPPMIVGIVASLEDTRTGAVFALVCGVFCDLVMAGVFPCLYTLAFPLAAVTCSYLAKNVVQPGPLCSLIVSALTFLYADALTMLSLALTDRAPFALMASVALREMALSCVLVPLCHVALTRLHRKFTI